MLRYLAALLVPATIFVLSPAPADAQYPGPPRRPPARHWVSDNISGHYENVSGGGECDVYRRGRGYVFINEHGSRAYFVYDGPGRLRMVSGEWDPSTRVTVSGDRYGRTVLRFETWDERPGYWVSME
jgi:hypothetical protein